MVCAQAFFDQLGYTQRTATLCYVKKEVTPKKTRIALSSGPKRWLFLPDKAAGSDLDQGTRGRV